MKLRTPQEMLRAYDGASKENPLIIRRGESEVFRKAMMIRCKQEDDRISGDRRGNKLTVFDADALLKDGIKSTIDGSIHSNRATYKDHLKRHGCVEIGNDFNKESAKPLEGDFNCRKELTEATQQVMEKYNG